MLKQYSPATIYRHAIKLIGQKAPFDARRNNRGRPKILSIQDRRAISSAVPILRKSCGSFTSPRVGLEGGVEFRASKRTVRRVLNEAGYHYFQSRKKGLLNEQNLKDSVKFCRKVRDRKLEKTFWNGMILFYLDVKGFQFKKIPLDQARVPTSREWKLKNEGLKQGCTAKVKKKGAVNCNFMVRISRSHGAVPCDQYFGATNGQTFAKIVEEFFPRAFRNSINLKKKTIQDEILEKQERLFQKLGKWFSKHQLGHQT